MPNIDPGILEGRPPAANARGGNDVVTQRIVFRRLTAHDLAHQFALALCHIAHLGFMLPHRSLYRKRIRHGYGPWNPTPATSIVPGNPFLPRASISRAGKNWRMTAALVSRCSVTASVVMREQRAVGEGGSRRRRT